MEAGSNRFYDYKSQIEFIENNFSIVSNEMGKNIPFKLFPHQYDFLKTLGEKNNVISANSRQCGITTLLAAWAAVACVFAAKNNPEKILYVNSSLDLASLFISKIRAFLMQVPKSYWGDKNEKSIFVTDSKYELELFNGCRIVSRSANENVAHVIGISNISILLLDDLAFFKNSRTVYESCTNVMASDPKTIIASVPNGQDGFFHTIYEQALSMNNNFFAASMKWYQDPRYNRGLSWHKKNSANGDDMVDADKIIDEQKNIKYDKERWEGLIKDGWKPTSAWYENMKMFFNNDAKKIAQELDASFQ